MVKPSSEMFISRKPETQEITKEKPKRRRPVATKNNKTKQQVKVKKDIQKPVRPEHLTQRPFSNLAELMKEKNN